MEKNKPQVVQHKHTHRFELGGIAAYIIGVIAILVFLFVMSYFHLWGQMQ